MKDVIDNDEIRTINTSMCIKDNIASLYLSEGCNTLGRGFHYSPGMKRKTNN